MTDQNELLETQRARHDVQTRLTEARERGHWYPWAALGLAACWWAAAGFAANAYMSTSEGLSGGLVAAVLVGASIPGFLIVFAGFLARDNVRGAAANAIVLDAAQSLLSPSSQLSSDAKLFASDMSNSAAEVDRAMGHALSAMKAMAGEIGDERLRLESVAYASADNARDLSDRLSTERASMEELARELKTQTENIADTLPRQANLIIEASERTRDEVGKVDKELVHRLDEMDGIGNTLGAKLVDLDRIAKDASQRAETLNYAVTRIEEKLEQSRKTVETAMRAGELAAAAAGTTGDALKDAVSSALTDARGATEEIHRKTRAAAEDMAKTLASLRQLCADTVSAMKLASIAAANEQGRAERAGGDRDNTLLGELSALSAEPEPAKPAAEERPRINRPARTETPDPAADILELGSTTPPVTPPPASLSASNGTKDHEDLFETPSPESEIVALNNAVDQIGEQNGSGSAWNDILSDMDNPALEIEGEFEPSLEEDREEAAERLINQLQSSGIRLPDTFKPKDKRKIAVAAQQGDNPRRAATLEVAKRQVERVSKRLEADKTLASLARVFVTIEQNDALTALEQTSKSGRNASPRLSAFLLVDAALGEGEQTLQH